MLPELGILKLADSRQVIFFEWVSAHPCYLDTSLMLSNLLKFDFPLWQYLNQPLGERTYPVVLNPRRFRCIHRVELLERCLEKSIESKGRRD
ncbi:hypothetical protein C7B65_10800 [Phormidesmis priestleyi ULC007]|uniref:Uncharacterized protein n=2 Tax=Phormidesmis priestleyi TaxID=268141 RepID=A0A2T1DH22_9CYAN|nr:hypothetical protein C7B65_10800 [Phormidesmis priestleyi ULC007]PZO53651.1 MAG: hypothetical protein DCF14_04505 [Phormidesmis priestleyi]